MRAVLFSSIFFVWLVACSNHYGNLEARKTYWQAMIKNELPSGVSRSKVETFFSRHGLEHGYDEQSRTMRAIERDVAGSSMVSFSVMLSCQFDTASALTACDISSVGTGP